MRKQLTNLRAGLTSGSTVIFLVSLFFSFLVLAGCGEKGPPVPPPETGLTIAAPYDLKLESSDNTVFLTWSHKTDPESAKVYPDRFDVFMAKKEFSGCVGCPFQFKTAGSVPVTEKKFSIEVEPGYKYYFRIQAAGADNLKSPYTKTVQFESK